MVKNMITLTKAWIAGGKWPDLGVSETADLLIFSHTTVPIGYIEWCEKQEHIH